MLRLSNNPISSIGDGVFRNNPKLNFLSLFYSIFSNTTELVDVSFSDYILEELDIGCSPFCHFDSFSDWDYFTNIRSFRAKGNHRAIQALYRMTSSLADLDLSLVPIGKLDAKLFLRFSNLQYLNLSRANISAIDKNAFMKQSKLEICHIIIWKVSIHSLIH